ncbi:MAG: Asp23/Gls24 family envelope stress response protein [Lawsonella sp.]|nr:Asp23/Gls24 family envelope stress response protein [Mycobacteriales bacterium]
MTSSNPKSQTHQDRAVPQEMGAAGGLHVDPAVANVIIREAALSVPGCIEHAVGMGHLTGKTLPQADLTMDGPYVAAEAHIAVSWPSPVAEVARTVRDTIRTHLEIFLEAKVTEVDVFVDDVTCSPAPGSKARPDRVTFEELANFDPTPAALTKNPKEQEKVTTEEESDNSEE